MGLSDLVGAITSIADVFTNLGKLVEYLIYGLFELLPAFIYILNPINIVNDSITGVIMAIKVLVTSFMGIFTSKNNATNNCKDTGSGLFGFRRAKTQDGKISGKCAPDRKCSRNKLLFLFITILCPPLALALHLGIKGWFHIIVSSVLTVYMYYFPGLIYTLLHIL